MSIKRISEPTSSQYSKKANPSHQIMCNYINYRELRSLNGSDSCANEPSQKLIPLKHTATGGGWSGYLSIRGTIALIEVGAANIVNRGRREVLWWILWPAKLLLRFAIDLD